MTPRGCSRTSASTLSRSACAARIILPSPAQVLASSCRAVFLEKPPTCSLQELDELLRLARAKGVPIIGSYSRHWAPHVLRLQELVAGGLIGDVKTVVGYCGGLFLSFASHTTDLICQFASYAPVRVTARGAAEAETVAKTPPGAGEPEPSLQSMFIEFGNGVTGFQVGADGPQGAFYVDVFGTNGRARAGMYLEPVVTDAKGQPIDLAPAPDFRRTRASSRRPTNRSPRFSTAARGPTARTRTCGRSASSASAASRVH